MVKKAIKAKKTAKRPTKRPIGPNKHAAGTTPTSAVESCRIMYRIGVVTRVWNPGEPVAQAMRDILEKHIPPITPTERMALEAKRRLHNELAGSVATEPTPERRRQTAAELLGAPAATEIQGTADQDPQPVKAARERPQLI